ARSDEELGAHTGRGHGGHLHVVEHAADLPVLEAGVARERTASMDIRIIRGLELRAVAPALAPQVCAAAYTPGDGQAHPPSTTRAFAAAAQRHGARYLTGAHVDRLTLDHARLTGLVRTPASVGDARAV